MPIKVRSLAGDLLTSWLPCPFEKVKQLKLHIAETDGTPVPCQKLLWAGQELADEATFAQLQVPGTATLQYVRVAMSAPEHIFWVGEVLVVMDWGMPCNLLCHGSESHNVIKSHVQFCPHAADIPDIVAAQVVAEHVIDRCCPNVRISLGMMALQVSTKGHGVTYVLGIACFPHPKKEACYKAGTALDDRVANEGCLVAGPAAELGAVVVASLHDLLPPGFLTDELAALCQDVLSIAENPSETVLAAGGA
eukprot:gnl/TRDRNA2_/TRDRNA2_30855_c0_seq1.p1 gnl/TRDRNA2_/TRDRNA2_30855_c0~~gnl/TRDRNA2_/TRDRNA2_30855_c0_seq1.p1  ORF type:complete len:250 (-),score=47.51 gnl/TRDRNA2_/TRDRNA2_30855_c0_seq1:84-833(-)